MAAQRGNPEPEELVAAAIASAALNLRVAGIGIVKSYDAAKQVCDVQPAVKRPIETVEGDLVQEPESIVQNVMVAHFGSAALSSHMTCAAGDAVLLVYLDYAPTLWRKRGGVADAPHTHKNATPIAIPFYRPSGGPGDDTDDSIGVPGGTRVRFEGGVVRVGATVDPLAEFVAQATKVATELNAIRTALASFASTQAGASTGPLAPLATGFTALGTAIGGPAGSVAASKLKTG